MCLEEFFAQGDQEKLFGVPVQFLNDREKLNRPYSQIGFLEFMIAPFFAAQILLFPKLAEYGDHLAGNLGSWEEEKAKVKARVEKVKLSLDEAKRRPVARRP